MKNKTIKLQNILKVLGMVSVGGMMACSNSNQTADSAALIDGGQTGATFSMKLTDSGASVASTQALVTANGLTFTKALLNAKEVKLYLPYGMTCADSGVTFSGNLSCEEENEVEDGTVKTEAKIKMVGPIVFNLIDGTSSPALETITLPSGIYRKVKVKLEKAETGELAGKTLVAQGSYVNALGATVPLDLAFDFSEEVKIENADGFKVKEQIQNAVTTTLDIASWFKDVNFEQCLTAGELDLSAGVLALDDNSGSGSCENIDELIKENIKHSMKCENEKENESSSDDSSGDDGVNHDAGDDKGGDRRK